MKKIPTLFERTYENHKVVGITDKVAPNLEWVLTGEGLATVKFDGSCCAIINGELYKRYDAKRGKKPPVGAIPYCEPDSITGHWPHWVKCDAENPADKWFFSALENYRREIQERAERPEYRTAYKKDDDGNVGIADWTYEAIGPHFQGNPYKLEKDVLVPHGSNVIPEKDEFNVRTLENIKKYLTEHEVEGIVFWKDAKPQCKIKRRDFGLEWPVR